jgi:hypothetical protein
MYYRGKVKLLSLKALMMLWMLTDMHYISVVMTHDYNKIVAHRLTTLLNK